MWSNPAAARAVCRTDDGKNQLSCRYWIISGCRVSKRTAPVMDRATCSAAGGGSTGEYLRLPFVAGGNAGCGRTGTRAARPPAAGTRQLSERVARLTWIFLSSSGGFTRGAAPPSRVPTLTWGCWNGYFAGRRHPGRISSSCGLIPAVWIF